MSALVL